ncbi:MAG: two-component system, OmpR family, alkaline phosphatase synthesis response regulator PhoP [Actinomycetota bacterium]|jgi:DNA-binding response OmpR family regulator
MDEQPRPRSKVVVVDDDAVAGDQIRGLLEAAGYDVSVIGNGEEALEVARTEPPRLVVLDVCLPGISGYEVCRELRNRFGEGLPIIFISASRTDSYDRVAGLVVGGDEYLTKPFADDELLIPVRRLLRRSAPLPAAVASRLTKREREVLALLAEGLDPREIATRLVLSRKTVATHLEHVLYKLGVHTQAQAVAAAYRSDLVDSAR